jgi:hypothetical protein
MTDAGYGDNVAEATAASKSKGLLQDNAPLLANSKSIPSSPSTAGDITQVRVHDEGRQCLREFIGFLKKLHAAYPPDIAIKVILGNEPTHVSEETKKWLALGV